MAESRKIIKVFLASPGDVVEERKLAKLVVEEVNQLLAEEYGYQLELYGWEDTTAAVGRPQAIINTELERCELFVGIMWKRWGTPPDKEGKYTSGFEEEYRTSVERYKKEGKPDISLFFKEVDPELTRDPGVALQKVLDFKKEITDGKEILYETFAESAAFEKKLRRCLVNYIKRLRSAEQNAAIPESNVPSETVVGRLGEKEKATTESLLSDEGNRFLRDFSTKLERAGQSECSPREVARFRLLGNILGRRENDDSVLGAHDCNLLFSIEPSKEFGKTELRALFRGGLEHFTSENAPIWCWLMALGGLKNGQLQYSSLIGLSEQRRAAALKAMWLLGERMENVDLESRSAFVERWLTSGVLVKQAALAYLADFGVVEDVNKIREEYNANDYQTRKVAAEAIIRIKLRESREIAIRALYELQPTSIDRALVDSLFQQPESIPSELLLEGLEHPDARVRTVVVAAARRLGMLDPDKAQKLLADADLGVRLLGLEALIDAGKPQTDEQAKSILQNGDRKPSLFSLGGISSQSYFEQYRHSATMSLPVSELERLADLPDLIFDRYPYFSLVEKQFSKRGEQLRREIDDGFENFIQHKIDAITRLVGEGSDTANRLKNLKKGIASEFVEAGISLLCKKSRPEDIGRIRKALRDEGPTSSFPRDLVIFIGRRGEWSDIKIIIEKSVLVDYKNFSLLSDVASDKNLVCANAILSIAKGRLPEVVRLEMSSDLLAAVVAYCADKEFKSLGDDAILSLLSHEADAVRRAVALKLMRCSSRDRVRGILSRYLSTRETWYYNVVHWLDMCISIPRDRVLSATEKTLAMHWNK